MAKVKLLDPSDPRRKLDRYELIGEIATGGMATVFLARLGGVGGFQRFVAIKRLHPHLANEQEFVEMFLDEARLAALIHHPHVVPILEVGVSDSGYYIVMEYVEGDTLSKIVARSMSGGKMVPRHILMRILLDMLSGLHAAHELTDDRGQMLGLVHRDVSPQNVLVGVDGSSRITDFGVARATARLTSTGSGKLKGKLAYMAPEQTRGDELDRRTDLFAAGIISWEVLAGKRLFKADTEAATLNRILVEPVRPVSEVNPEIPAPFDIVLAKALDRDPRKRFQTAQEMFDAFEKTANEVARASGVEVGIASPREVASYVQTILGQEIGAQRESVRAWLAQSDSSAPRAVPGPGGTVRTSRDRRARREGDEDSRSESYPSHDGPQPVAPMADVTMRFALQSNPPRPPPPAKQSSPTLIGQGPPAPPATRPMPGPAAGFPPREAETTREQVGLAVAGLGEEGDDAPTVLRQSSRPPDAEEPVVPPPTVKTARGLFAADLLERARIEAEKAQAARNASGLSGSSPQDAVTGIDPGRGDPGRADPGRAESGRADPQAGQHANPGQTTGRVQVRSDAPQGDQPGTSLTNGSMTLPSHYQVSPSFESIPEPRKGGAVRYVVLGVVGLALAAAFVVFMQFRSSGSGDAGSATSAVGAEKAGSEKTGSEKSPTPTAKPSDVSSPGSASPSGSATSSAGGASTSQSTPQNAKPSGKPGRVKPGPKDPPSGSTSHPVDSPPPTPPPSQGSGDDLSNPYQPK